MGKPPRDDGPSESRDPARDQDGDAERRREDARRGIDPGNQKTGVQIDGKDLYLGVNVGLRGTGCGEPFSAQGWLVGSAIRSAA